MSKNIVKATVALASAALSALYLSNVGAGVVEIIPDNFPVAGNIDEFVASLILIRSLAYLGWKPKTRTGVDPAKLEPRRLPPSGR